MWLERWIAEVMSLLLAETKRQNGSAEDESLTPESCQGRGKESLPVEGEVWVNLQLVLVVRCDVREVIVWREDGEMAETHLLHQRPQKSGNFHMSLRWTVTLWIGCER